MLCRRILYALKLQLRQAAFADDVFRDAVEQRICAVRQQAGAATQQCQTILQSQIPNQEQTRSPNEKQTISVSNDGVIYA